MAKAALHLVVAVAAGLLAFSGLGAHAQEADLRFEALAPDERAIIDRLAADFYENELRYAQSSLIEQRTAQLYAQGSPDRRAAFRASRRDAWRELSEAERARLRDAKRPEFHNLTDAQKAPFRRHALDQLGAGGALDPDALRAAFANDV